MKKIFNILLAIVTSFTLAVPAVQVYANDISIKVLVKPKLDVNKFSIRGFDAPEFSDGLMLTHRIDLEDYYSGFCYFDKNLDMVIENLNLKPEEYIYPEEFHNGVAVVGNGDSYGLINKTGKLIVPFKYSSIDNSPEDSLISVRGESKYGYIDNTGKVIIPIKYDYVTTFSGQFEGLAHVDYEDDLGFIDKTGKTVIPFQSGYIDGSVSEGLLLLVDDDKQIYMDSTGKKVLTLAYDPDKYSLRSFSEGMAAIEDIETNKKGFIDKTGKIVIKPIYNYCYPFSDGLAMVNKDSKDGYINKKGELVVPLNYDFAESFSGGTAIVAKNEKYGIIDTQGKVLVPLKYDRLTRLTDDLFSAGEGVRPPKMSPEAPENYIKYGIINSTGKLITPIKYDLISVENPKDKKAIKEVALVEKDNKYGYINISTGKEIVTPKYFSASPFVDGLAFFQETPIGKIGILQIER